MGMSLLQLELLLEAAQSNLAEVRQEIKVEQQQAATILAAEMAASQLKLAQEATSAALLKKQSAFESGLKIRRDAEKAAQKAVKSNELLVKQAKATASNTGTCMEKMHDLEHLLSLIVKVKKTWQESIDLYQTSGKDTTVAQNCCENAAEDLGFQIADAQHEWAKSINTHPLVEEAYKSLKHARIVHTKATLEVKDWISWGIKTKPVSITKTTWSMAEAFQKVSK
jgi:hypothetical protein